MTMNIPSFHSEHLKVDFIQMNLTVEPTRQNIDKLAEYLSHNYECSCFLKNTQLSDYKTTV